MNALELEKEYISLVKQYIKERDSKNVSEKKIKMIEREQDNIVKEIDLLGNTNIWLNICEKLFTEEQYSLKVWAAGTISYYDKKRAGEMMDDIEKKATDMQKLVLKGMRNCYKI